MKVATKEVEEYWVEFCAVTGTSADEPYQFWYFGNTAEMAAELAQLVIEGRKTATASLSEVNELIPDEAPVLGGYSVVTDFEGQPRCVVRTIGIRHIPFCEVDSQFAFDEGEGDRSLVHWREVHSNYFADEAAAIGIGFGNESMICCERFELLYK
ncbi:MAG: ASCH domain-containing protein [Pyrinomonadaceae bacterium]|nr:ASCH domain-containing protein [Pyrinomonadaceae bacterium]